MLKRKDLMFLRHNKEKKLIGFSYIVKGEESGEEVEYVKVDWRKGNGTGVWRMRALLDIDVFPGNQEVYNIDYQMPRDGMPVELIAATGLKYLQLSFREEVQKKSNIDFAIGDIVKDM